MRKLLSKTWVKVALLVMGLPPALADASTDGDGGAWGGRFLEGTMTMLVSPQTMSPSLPQ